MKMKNKRKLVDELIDQVDSGDGMAEVEMSQDARAEAIEAAERVLKAAGHSSEDENWDDLVDELAGEVEWIPAHWRKVRLSRRKK